MEENQNEAQASPKQQVSEKIRQAANVLVTVRTNPSVDELAAAIGLTLMLNKLEKHATAVFSGQVPSTLEFLKPEETIETNTDSLRDFIVSLDKAKADKLRYKVEENVVKIFITPYRTSITQDDLEFTQGDFNVDVVLALGVTQREELDQAITAHGRILHDATVVTVIAGQKESELGNINWQDTAASSLSEMLVSISEALQGGLIDSQIATAFLTGIVAETERFSNPKTSPKVMTMAAQLMAAGANQQLIANELQKQMPPPAVPPQDSNPKDIPEESNASVGSDGSLNIDHNAETKPPQEMPSTDVPKQASEEQQLPEVKSESNQADTGTNSTFLTPLPSVAEPEAVNPLLGVQSQESESHAPEEQIPSPINLPPTPTHQPSKDDIHIDHEGNITKPNIAPKHKIIQPLGQEGEQQQTGNSYLIGQPDPGQSDGSMQTSVTPTEAPTVTSETTESHQSDGIGLPPMPSIPEDEAPEQLNDNTTLEQIEESVHSPHLGQPQQPNGDVDSIRNAVNQVYDQSDFDPAGHAQANLGAMPLGDQLHPGDTQKDQIVEPSNPVVNDQNQQNNEGEAPPVPPPFMGQ